MGCEYGQGFLFARPATFDAIAQRLGASDGDAPTVAAASQQHLSRWMGAGD
jgi:hypothetical protein